MPIPTRRSYVLVATLPLLLISLAACSGGYGKSVPKLPGITPYPNAQQLQVQDVTTAIYQPAWRTTFATSDQPDVILDFYKNVLPKARWALYVPNTPETGNTLHFQLIEGCQLSQLSIVAQPDSQGLTTVELRETSIYCD
jgi:hypothetical protein